MKAWVAAALMVVPLLIAAAIAYWPAKAVTVATVVIPPPDVHGRSDISGLAKDVPAILIPLVVVDKSNVDATIIKDGYHTRQEIYGQ